MPRVAAVAARFRVVDSFEAFADHMAELLDRARGADVVVLPELVTAELLCIEPGWRDASMNDLPVIAKHEARLKDWFAAEDSVATEMICMVLSSVAAVAPPAPTMTNCRLLAADTAVKLVNLSPETVTWSRAAKFVATSSTAVLLLSS